jgi:hypothetical protein
MIDAPLVGRTRRLLRSATDAYAGTPAAPLLEAAAARLDEPLRVAIAGRVKAGKSTLLNALVGQELAATDAGECTRIVTWYRNGLGYRLLLEPRVGPARELPWSQRQGGLAIDLGPLAAEEVERLVVEWPSRFLRAMTLIDTPGMGSARAVLWEPAQALLAPAEDGARPADAILYLLRHLHPHDVRLLEAFHDEQTRARPVNAIGVLSRADEIGSGRLDALESAQRVAGRYRSDARLRALCQTVIPVAGLLASSGSTLREGEYRSLAAIAALPAAEAERLLVSADRFAGASLPLTPTERAGLLARLGLFGVRLSVALIRSGAAPTSPALARELVRRSGLEELRRLLLTRFGARADILRSRSALLGLSALLRRFPAPQAEPVRAQLERVLASAHEFAEIDVFDALRSGDLGLPPAAAAEAERLLGSEGGDVWSRLGAPPQTPVPELERLAHQALDRWRRLAASPLAERRLVGAAQVIVRSCEGMLAALAPGAAAPTAGAG